MISKKNMLAIGLGIIIIIGGLIMVKNPFTGEEESKYKNEQDRIARYLVNHIELVDGESIEKIEITEFQKNRVSGTWWISVIVNDKYNLKFSESEIGGSLRIGGYYSHEIKIFENSSAEKSVEGLTIIFIE